MNIKIVDSWLREFLDTKASSSEIAKELSLTSVSVERTEKVENDLVYEIEVTTNRPDLMSVQGIAREAATVLKEQGIEAKYAEPKEFKIKPGDISFPIEIINDPELVNRVLAVVLEVKIGQSPDKISKRLEASGIRSLNNVIDVTNYIMREVGHPCHVFDFDLIATKKMIIRRSKKDEVVTTLDGKQYRLMGDDIVADDGNGQIIDLLGVMGTQNSVVQDNTKRIIFFLDNNNPQNIRKTSMSLGIRTEAAVINEKGIDPELAMEAFERGIKLYEEIAEGKVISKVLDIYPNKASVNLIKVTFEKINSLIGIEISPSKSKEILEKLGFEVKMLKDGIEVKTPTIRPDVKIEEDVIEEIARVYGYHKLPSIIPTFLNNKEVPFANNFYFEKKVKNALKYWGFNEVYTYSLISEDLYDGPIEKAIKLKNPLSDEMVFLRNSLIPSLLSVVEENKKRDEIKIFEIANVYEKKSKDLPVEHLTLGLVIKKRNVLFFEAKGIVEALFIDLGIKNFKFKNRTEGPGAEILINSEKVGYIEILNTNLVNFEIKFNDVLKHANLKKIYKPLAKFPPVVEDLTLIVDDGINTETLIEEIQMQSDLISDVSLKDQYELSKTFHIVYQAEDRNLTNEEVSEIREKIISSIQKRFKATVK